MERTFGFDVLACPRRILRHLGVPTEIPSPRPARAPPILTGTPDQAGWDDDPSVFNSGS